MNKSQVMVSAVSLALGMASVGYAASINSNHDSELIPTGKGYGIEDPSAGRSAQIPGRVTAARVPSTTITYHGGPVMVSQTNVYYIWYGNWSGNSAVTILTDLARGFTGSAIYNTNSSYYNGSGARVQNVVNYVQSTTDNYSLGSSLSDANIQTIVASAISSGRLPKDTNGVYFVLTSADVKETSGFGSQYCGWHTNGTIGGSDIKYSFVGDATTQAPTGCIAVTAANSPNGNMGADGMASVLFHELSETVTDPDLNAWYDRRGNENADKCAWTFGTTYTTPTGKKANVHLGARDFLLQQNWVNSGAGFCALSY